MTSRWLVGAAAKRNVTIEWRSLSLGVLNAGREIPERFRPAMEAGRSAHRLIVALRADGRNDLVGDLYTELGRHIHHDGEAPTVDLVAQAATTVGAGAWAAAAEDPAWDVTVEESTAEAVALTGPDVGSPVLAFGEPRVGIFGPIVSPPPTGEDAVRLFDHTLALMTIPGFFELKRGRDGGPLFGPRP